MYFNVKVKLTTDTDKGPKDHVELYLVDAVSVTDAEAKMFEDFKGFPNDWVVIGVDKSKVVKVIGG
jgi:hypothetical protein